MPNPFQIANIHNAPFGGVQETSTLIPLTGRSIAISIFSDFSLASGGWAGVPSGWAGLGTTGNGCGFNNILGSPTVQAGPMTTSEGNYFNWSSTLLLFAANQNLGFIGDLGVSSGAFGTVSATFGFDIPAGSTLVAVLQGTALFFPTTPILSSVTDTLNLPWSPIQTSLVTSSGSWLAAVATSVVMNSPHIPAGTDVVTFTCAQSGNNSIAHVLVFTGAVPLGAGGAFGSMLL
jgi:hypothetical protein